MTQTSASAALTSLADLAALAERSYSGPQSGMLALDVRYDFIVRGDELIVVFPGTHPDDPLDWIRDLRVIPRPFRGLGLLHAGFGTGGFDLWGKFGGNYRSRKFVTYVGHSLGGALAQVVGAFHGLKCPETPFRVVTFGAPRVAFLTAFRCAWYLRRGAGNIFFQRDGDPVPAVPFWPMYWRPGRGTRIGIRVPNLISNHSMARYRADVEALPALAGEPKLENTHVS